MSTSTSAPTSTSTSISTSSHTSPPSNSTPSPLSALHSTGFIKIPALLSPPEISALRSACQEATSRARAGKWPYIRTLPKQFPPWPSTPPLEGIWGVQHLLHPDMPGREVFAASYFHEKLLGVVEEILGVDRDGGNGNGEVNGNGNGNGMTNGSNGSNGSKGNEVSKGGEQEDKEEKLVMELYNLLVRPDSDFELRWHRDDIPPTASSLEEELALGVDDGKTKAPIYTHTQWNLALEPDDSLIVVPGTHKRARTKIEREAGIHDVLPDQLVVHLDPGDVVFYDNDILHRGKYDSTRERFTLHGSVGKKGFTGKRARNVLQHGVGDWIADCRFDDDGDDGGRGLERGVAERAMAMRRNLMQMGSGMDVGFSQSD